VELNLNPAYVSGAHELLPASPGDCSGKLYAIFASCGVQVIRTTANRMAAGLDGWNFAKVLYPDMRILAVVHMTVKKTRPQGHVGIIVVVIGNQQYSMAHASESAGFIAVKVFPGSWVHKDFDWSRQTTK
jgi:hypothetical protein